MARHDLRHVRSFIAVELSGGLKHRAQELAKKLKVADAEVKWVDFGQMHLTLKFLGDVPRDDILPLCRVIREVAEKFEPFDLQFGGIGAFPDIERPRAIWIGVREGAEQLGELQRVLDLELSKQLGFAKEHRKFTPHLTIGRVHTFSPALTELLERHAEFEADFSEVDELVAFASFTDRDTTRHEALGHAVLGESASKPLVDDEEEEEELEDEELEDDELDEDEDEFDDDEDLEDEDVE